MNLARLLVAIGATTTGFQRGIAAAERRVDALERRSRVLAHTMGTKVTAGIRKFALVAAGVGIAALVALTAATVGGIQASIRYEDAFAGVRKTVNASDAELDQLSKDFRKMATEIPIAATELAGLGETAGALGVKTKDIKEFVRVTALLGVTTNIAASDAADALGILGNVLHLNAKDYSRFGSALVALGNAGASTESQIIEIAKRAGGAGKLLKLSTAQILGFSSAVASLGIEPEAAGTALQTFFTKTLKTVAGGGKKLAALAKAAGMTGKQFTKAFKKDASGALVSFFKGLNKLSTTKRLKVLESLGFTDVRVTRTLLGLAGGSKELARQLGVSEDAWKKNTAMTTEAEKRFATTKSQLTLLGNNLTEIAMTLGDIFLPMITPLVKGLNDWISKNHDLIAQLAGDLGRGIQMVVGAIAGWVSANWPLIQQIGKLAGDVLGGLYAVITTRIIPALFGKDGNGGIVGALVSFGTTAADWLIPKIQAFVDTMTKPGGVADSIMSVVGPIMDNLIPALAGIITALFGGTTAGGGRNGRAGAKTSVGLIPALGQLAGTLWDDGKSPLAIAFKLIGQAIGSMIGQLGQMIEQITTAIGWIDKLAQSLGQSPEAKSFGDRFRAKYGRSPTPNDYNIWKNGGYPGLARGGLMKLNQPTWIGEKGPELAERTPRGVMVHSAAASRQMADGGGDTYNLNMYGPVEGTETSMLRSLDRMKRISSQRQSSWSVAAVNG